MIRSVNSLIGYKLCATDGEMGTVEQFFFDYDTWTVRYIVMRSGKWLLGRQVLISPIGIEAIEDGRKAIMLNLKRFRVGNIPSVNLGRPLSRQYEREYHQHFGWPYYAGGKGRWGDEQYPSQLFTVAPLEQTAAGPDERQLHADLGSTDGIKGYRVFAGDRDAGSVTDFLVDDQTWALRYLIVASAGRTLPVSPHWMAQLADAERMITLDVTPAAIENAPAYGKPSDVTQGYEMTLFKHFGYDREIDSVHVRPRVPA
jgi:hypothetical protein